MDPFGEDLAPPGTEDDPLPIVVSKKESEIERLLSIKAYLPPRYVRLGNVFECNKDKWYCHMCQCPVNGQVFYHEEGKRHKASMEAAKLHTLDKEAPDIAPGEPLPPGFEEDFKRPAIIQERIDNFKSSALIGLEYLVELQDNQQDREPSYSCLLCGKKGVSGTIIPHMMSNKHVECYIQRHFPTAFTRLGRFYCQRKYKKARSDTVTKIAEAIERNYGRMRPLSLEASSFQGDREQEIYVRVLKGPHFNERLGNTFENLVDVDKIAEEPDSLVVSPESSKGKRRSSLSPVSSVSSGEKKAKETIKDRGKERDRYRERDRDRALYNRRGQRSPLRSSLPWHDPDYRRKRNATTSTSEAPRNESKREEFRRLSQVIEKDKERILRQHRLNPEKHPQYNEEWKRFWNLRYKELQAEGADVARHDFKPEWIVFWSKRMEELHRDDVKKDVEALRKRLGITDIAPISFRIGVVTPGAKPIAAQPDQDHEVIVIDDGDEEKEKERHRKDREPPKRTVRSSRRSRSKSPALRSRNRRRTRSRSRSHSPWEESPSGRRRTVNSKRSRSKSLRSRSNSKSRAVSSRRGDKKKDVLVPNDLPFSSGSILMRESQLKRKEEEEALLAMDVSVISVLRLLTALEDLLGVLGPKIVDLLAKALAMEKREPNSAERLLDDEEVCTVMETTKEKLKGLMHANLVGFAQERAVKGAVTKIAALMHQHQQTETKRREEAEEAEILERVNKTEVAKQISIALVLQGKTNVSQTDLENLVRVVMQKAMALKRTSKDVNAGLRELEQKGAVKLDSTPMKEEDQGKTEPDGDRSGGVMDGLSDLELQALLQSFKDLSSEEQHGLITYLKKLEAKEPERVETLRKFVNLTNTEGSAEVESETSGKISPFSQKLNQNQASPSKKIVETVKSAKNIDSDDDDYTYEDVFKAASKNVQSAEGKTPKFDKGGSVVKDGVVDYIANMMAQNQSAAGGTPQEFAPGGALSKMPEQSYRSQMQQQSQQPRQFSNNSPYPGHSQSFNQLIGSNGSANVSYPGFGRGNPIDTPLRGHMINRNMGNMNNVGNPNLPNQANMVRGAHLGHQGPMGNNVPMNYANRWY